MKKIFTLIFLVLTLMMLGCGSTAKSEAPAAKKEATKVTTTNTNTQGKKALVVYFSASGTTKAAAQKLSKAANADLFEIVPEKPYSNADLNYRNSSSRSCQEHADASIRPAIKNKIADLKKYEVVYIGYPIWWGMAPNIMKTFMESYDFSGKTLVPFCTVISSGFGNSDQELKALAPKAKWIPGADLTHADPQTLIAKVK